MSYTIHPLAISLTVEDDKKTDEELVLLGVQYLFYLRDSGIQTSRSGKARTIHAARPIAIRQTEGEKKKERKKKYSTSTFTRAFQNVRKIKDGKKNGKNNE